MDHIYAYRLTLLCTLTPTCLLTYEVHFRTPEITYTNLLLLYHIRTYVSLDFDIALCYFYYISELQNS